MPSILITIKNLDEIMDAMGELATMAWVRGILGAAAQDVKSAVAVYPPETEANAPRGFNTFYNTRTRKADNTWYVRGFGTRRVRKDGSIGGRQTSQTLGRRWTTRVADTWAKIGNNASYAMYVQDEDMQAAFHKERGWVTVQDEGEKAMEEALRKVEAEIDRIWK